jgi:hypothetical protein
MKGLAFLQIKSCFWNFFAFSSIFEQKIIKKCQNYRKEIYDGEQTSGANTIKVLTSAIDATSPCLFTTLHFLHNLRMGLKS